MGPAVVEAAAVDAAWLTQGLRQAGVLGADGAVAGFSATGVGNGLVGTSVRYALRYAGDAAGAPASVVGKFPATDATSRQSGAAMRLYLREVNFYRHVAKLAAIRTPRVLASGFDAATHDFFLLFEDLAPARGGDQLAGCDAADAAVAMQEIAGLHAPLWGSPAVAGWDWLRLPEEITGHLVSMVAPVAEMFRERFRDVLEPEIMQAAMGLVPLARPLLSGHAERPTVLHGDFRLDNVLFDAKGGAWKMATLDWQTVSAGRGTQDASYFIGAGLRADDRPAVEGDLVRHYHAALLAGGVQGYDWEECWRDYRKHSLNGLFMAMFSAISVARTARGDEMFLTMARRHARQALELQAFALWN